MNPVNLKSEVNLNRNVRSRNLTKGRKEAALEDGLGFMEKG